MNSSEAPDRMKATGVYAIVNLVNGKRYVGSAATSFENRWRQHRKSLIRGQHHSSYLQRSWNKYGESSFEFRVVEVVLPEHAVACEQVMIDYYRSADTKFGYNVSPTAGSPLGVKHSLESRARMAAAQRGLKRSPEAIAKSAAALRGRTQSPEHVTKSALARRGLKRSQETRERMSSSKRGRKQSPEHAAKIALALRGRKVSPETRERIASAQRGRRLSPEHLENVIAANRRPKSPETIERMAAANRGRKQSPESVEMRIAKSVASRRRNKASRLLIVIENGVAQ